ERRQVGGMVWTVLTTIPVPSNGSRDSLRKLATLGTKASKGNHPGIALRIFHGTWHRGFRRTILKNNVGLKKFERATMTRIGRYQVKSRQLYWQCFLSARQSRPAQISPKLKQRLYSNAA